MFFSMRPRLSKYWVDWGIVRGCRGFRGFRVYRMNVGNNSRQKFIYRIKYQPEYEWK